VPSAVVSSARDADALAAFRRLLAEYQAALDPDLRVPNLEDELQTLAERYPEPSCALLLARAGDEDVGCVIVKALDASTAEIKRLYVAPAARGSGAGRALMEAAIDFARERTHTRIVLDTERVRLVRAYTLYRSLGFVHCAPYAPPEYENPTYMELSIGETTPSRADS